MTTKPYFCVFMITLLTRDSNNQPVSLIKQLASSGEGEVWETNQSGYLAKIYHDPTPERIEKLKVMLANPPVDPMFKFNHVSIAWLKDLLKDSSGKYVGFLMPAIENSKQLSTIYHPKLRKKNAPGFNWRYLHVAAMNIAWIIQQIHEKGYVVGDIKIENILVNARALVAVIDTDSFQVRDSQTGKVYRCTVGSEGFTPAELLGKDFSVIDQTEVHDRFRLAILIHYLLFGYHPFLGEWKGSGECPAPTELIRQGYWLYGKSSLIRPSQNHHPLDIIHPKLQRCFLKCFNSGHESPDLRPTAEDWHNALKAAIEDLKPCSKVNNHHYSGNYGMCHWCDTHEKRGIDHFPAVPTSLTLRTARSRGILGSSSPLTTN
jgi:DNA-binding helix-hairpin-helix protein with protein kinase domain